MKILNLKFKNINSLAGEWEIDFTKPQLTDNGLFVITGKTGSGKSSILDAISLALYGRTPRVMITGQNNDVMTRGTIDCYSEIAVEVGGKVWKTSWKHEKTRNGNLKPVVRQIADANNRIIADQVRSCESKITEIIGLTFEQFTKVILLAQGGFAAFLQADKNEKGELLEQITGTEIYGEISKKVYERNKREKDKLDQILLKLDAIKILSTDEIENLNHEIKELELQKQITDNEIQVIEKTKKWIVDSDNLQKQIAGLKLKTPELAQRVIDAKAGFEQSESALQSAKNEKEITDIVLVKVRDLDTKIHEKENRLKPIEQSLDELNKDKINLSTTIKQREDHLVMTRNLLKQIEDWAVNHEKYENLIGQFAAIENKNVQVGNILNDLNVKNIELENAKKDFEAKKVLLTNAKQLLTQKESLFDEKNRFMEAKKQALKNLLTDRILSDYQKEKDDILQFGILIKHLIEIEKMITDNRKEIEKYSDLIQTAELTEKKLIEQLAENKTSEENIRKQIERLDENIKLAKTIQSLDEHRKSLTDGVPCPLCGALEHPFTQGIEPKIDEKERELKNLKKQEQMLSSAILQDEKTKAKIRSDINHSLINCEKEKEKLITNRQKCEEVIIEIVGINSTFSITDEINRIDFLEKIHLEKRGQFQQISNIIKKAEDCEKHINILRDREIPQLLTAKQMTEKATNEAEIQQKLSEQKVHNQEELVIQAKTIYETENADLLKSFSEYDATNMEGLKKNLNTWNHNKKKIEELNNQIIALSNDIELKNNELKNKNNGFAEKQNEQLNIKSELQTLVSLRIDCFGTKKTEDEADRLKKALTEVENAKAKAEQVNNFSITELEKNMAIIAEKENQLSDKQKEMIEVKTYDELQNESDEKKKQSDEFSQKIGANRQTLHINENHWTENSRIIKEKIKQEEIYRKWGSLNKLIGSEDGKRYRNFAQALTFEHLIALANRQLQKMSERYILKRAGDAQNPFDLLVIDKYQNCEERTAQNLSGGEKFIVSLSLALGLANMVSRNMKIDTMFIDEGFGTLDADYLDIALTALSNLHHEGKLIGVISHLSELKERIATHIEVVTQGNGHSRIVW
jgi:exonuclease SbcC